jgi:antitoxin component YwqK of YwqJK toxin-antitoxin module
MNGEYKHYHENGELIKNCNYVNGIKIDWAIGFLKENLSISIKSYKPTQSVGL